MAEVSTDSDVKIPRPDELPSTIEVASPDAAALVRDEIRREFAAVFEAQRNKLSNQGGTITYESTSRLNALLHSMDIERSGGQFFSFAEYDKEVKAREKIVIEMCEEFGWRASLTSFTKDGGHSIGAKGAGAGETEYSIHLSPIK